jgi:hypothetical protein
MGVAEAIRIFTAALGIFSKILKRIHERREKREQKTTK